MIDDPIKIQSYFCRYWVVPDCQQQGCTILDKYLTMYCFFSVNKYFVYSVQVVILIYFLTCTNKCQAIKIKTNLFPVFFILYTLDIITVINCNKNYVLYWHIFTCNNWYWLRVIESLIIRKSEYRLSILM